MRNLKGKNKKGGIASEAIAGIGALVILVIITLLIVSTILNANLLRTTAGATTALDVQIPINLTGTTLSEWSTLWRDYTITSVVNDTGGITLTTANYSFNAATGVISSANTLANMSQVNVSYSYFKPTSYEDTASGMAGNFTKGIDNVSQKLPTILLITAVVLLFSVLVFLVVKSRQLTGTAGTSGSFGGGKSEVGFVGNESASGVGGVGGSL